MLFSFLSACFPCFSQGNDDPSQDDDQESSIEPDQILPWSLTSSASYDSNTSTHGSSSGDDGMSSASHKGPHPRSALRQSIDHTPRSTSIARLKKVRWSEHSSVEDDRIGIPFSSKVHQRRHSRKKEIVNGEEKEWHRGQPPLPIRVQVRSASIKKKRSSLTSRSSLSPSFIRRKYRRFREVLYPIVERPRQSASVLDVYRYKQALLVKREPPKPPISPVRARRTRNKQPPPPSPSKIFVEELKKSMLAFDSDPFNVQFDVSLHQQDDSCSGGKDRETFEEVIEPVEIVQQYDTTAAHRKRNRRKPVNYDEEGDPYFASQAYPGRRKQKRNQVKVEPPRAATLI